MTKNIDPKLQRQREWHGWAFRDYSREQCDAIKHYIDTGERLPELPR